MNQVERPTEIGAGCRDRIIGGALFLALGTSAFAVTRDAALAALVLQLEQECFRAIQAVPTIDSKSLQGN